MVSKCLKMANPEKISVDVKGLEDIWLLRPCELYLEEFSDCSSFRGRFHQYYIAGSFADCEQWRKDHNNCLKFRKSGDAAAAEAVIASEKVRREERLCGAQGNDVWQYRRSPPADWNVKLTEWTSSRQETLLAKAQARKENTGTLSGSDDSSRCVVS